MCAWVSGPTSVTLLLVWGVTCLWQVLIWDVPFKTQHSNHILQYRNEIRSYSLCVMKLAISFWEAGNVYDRLCVMGNIIRTFWPNSCLCWRKLKGVDGFSIMWWLPTLQTQLLYCKSYLGTALLGLTFDHLSLQTSYHPISFYRDLLNKESAAWITYEVWRKQNILLNRLVSALTHKFFLSYTKHI